MAESEQLRLLREWWATDVARAHVEFEVLKEMDKRPLFLGGHCNHTGCVKCQLIVLGGPEVMGSHSCLGNGAHAPEPYLIGDGMWDIFPEGCEYIEYVRENGNAEDECVFLANLVAHILLKNYKPEYLYTIQRIMEVNVNGL